MVTVTLTLRWFTVLTPFFPSSLSVSGVVHFNHPTVVQRSELVSDLCFELYRNGLGLLSRLFNFWLVKKMGRLCFYVWALAKRCND